MVYVIEYIADISNHIQNKDFQYIWMLSRIVVFYNTFNQ